jgi:hypothetical protein
MDDIEAWLSALGTLPELLGPGDLPKLNEGLRYLFKELRQAQAAFSGGSHQDGVYSSLVAVSAFLNLFRAVRIEGLTLPLAALESALWALDEGVTEPLLKPARRAKGGPPEGTTTAATIHRYRGLHGTLSVRVRIPALEGSDRGGGRSKTHRRGD